MSNRNVYFASRIAPRTRVSTQEQAEKPSTTLVKSSETNDDLSTIVAGQATEIAQLKQAMLILAQATKSVELNTDTISDSVELLRADMQLVIQQTAPTKMPWKTIVKKIDTAWQEIIADTDFLQLDCDHITRSRSAGTFFSFGTRAPEVIKTQKREVEVLIKSIKSQRAIIEQYYEHACKHYPDDIAFYMKEMRRKLTINDDTRMAPTQSWTISQIFSLDFIEQLRRGLYARRGV